MDTVWTNPLLIEGAVFAAVSSVVWLAWGWTHRFDPRVANRLQTLRTKDQDRFTGSSRLFNLWMDPSFFERLPGLARHLLPTDDQARLKLQTRLLQAGIYHERALVTFFVVRMVAMLAPLATGVLLGLLHVWNLRSGMCMGAIAGGLGILLPGIWLDRMVARRHHRLRQALPDFLDLFVACVECGMTAQATMKQVADELHTAHPELAGEFTVCCQQVELGYTFESAMNDLAERTALEELRTLSTYVQQAQRFGATMASALRELSDTLRAQRELRAEELAQKAAVKILIPTILFIFPAVFVVLAAPAAIRIYESLTHPNAKVVRGSK